MRATSRRAKAWCRRYGQALLGDRDPSGSRRQAGINQKLSAIDEAPGWETVPFRTTLRRSRPRPRTGQPAAGDDGGEARTPRAPPAVSLITARLLSASSKFSWLPQAQAASDRLADLCRCAPK